MYQFDFSSVDRSAVRGSSISLLLEKICRTVVDEGVIVYDGEGKPVSINRAAAHMCGGSCEWVDFAIPGVLEHLYSVYEVSNLAGKKIPQDEHPLALARRSLAFTDRVVKLKDRTSEEVIFLRFDGDRIHDRYGDLRYFVATVRNITDKKELEAAIQDGNTRLRLLSESIADLLLSEDPLGFLDTVYERISGYLDLEIYFHFQVTPDDQRLKLAAYQGVSEKVVESFRYLEFGEAVCGTVAESRSRIIAENIQESGDRLTALIRRLGITAYICHPLMVRGRLLGTLSFGTRTARSFSSSTIEVIRALCDQMAVALYTIELRDRTREISNKLVRVEEEERRKIARELHDELGGQLSLLKQHLLKREGHHDEFITRVDELIQQVRSLTLDLRPAALDEVGFVRALRQFVDRFTDQTGIHVDFISEMSDEDLPAEKAIVLYRLVQEALTNVARHASVDSASVSLHRDENEISVHIIDEGVGFDKERLSTGGKSSGLQNMQERIELMNGHFFVESSPGRGTHVSAVIEV